MLGHLEIGWLIFLVVCSTSIKKMFEKQIQTRILKPRFKNGVSQGTFLNTLMSSIESCRHYFITIFFALQLICIFYIIRHVELVFHLECGAYYQVGCIGFPLGFIGSFNMQFFILASDSRLVDLLDNFCCIIFLRYFSNLPFYI